MCFENIAQTFENLKNAKLFKEGVVGCAPRLLCKFDGGIANLAHMCKYDGGIANLVHMCKYDGGIANLAHMFREYGTLVQFTHI
jgi:hypothetical protein